MSTCTTIRWEQVPYKKVLCVLRQALTLVLADLPTPQLADQSPAPCDAQPDLHSQAIKAFELQAFERGCHTAMPQTCDSRKQASVHDGENESSKRECTTKMTTATDFDKLRRWCCLDVVCVVLPPCVCCRLVPALCLNVLSFALATVNTVFSRDCHCLVSLFCLLSFVSCLLSLVFCVLSFVSCHCLFVAWRHKQDSRHVEQVPWARTAMRGGCIAYDDGLPSTLAWPAILFLRLWAWAHEDMGAGVGC